MFIIFISFFLLFFNLTNTNKCLFETTSIKYESIYLCREKLNSTSLRIWLHLKLNGNETEVKLFSYYKFTLRIIDLLDEHKLRLEDRFEKPISDYVKIDINKKENNTINILNLLPGRYEICVNFFNDKKIFYYRSLNNCLYIPWNAPEYEMDKPNLLMQVVLIIAVIFLLAAMTCLACSIHAYIKSRKPPVVLHNIDDDIHDKEEDNDHSECVKLLVHQHFAPKVTPFEHSVRKRIHQRYAHRSPDLNDI